MYEYFLVTEYVDGIMYTHWFNGDVGRDMAREFIQNCKNPYTTTVVRVPAEYDSAVSISIATPDDSI